MTMGNSKTTVQCTDLSINSERPDDCSNVIRPNLHGSSSVRPFHAAIGGLTNEDQEELQRLKWGRTCKVCLDRWVYVVLIPCGHLVCEECSSKLPSCPFCRGQIQQRLNISFS